MIKRQHAKLNTIAHRQPPRLKLQQTPEMGIRQRSAFEDPNTVAEESKWPLRGNTRVQLAQRASGRITRVSKHLSSAATRLFVYLFETGLRQEHFSAHLQTGRNVLSA